MPSPRWPRRAIETRSATPGPDQELAVALAAEDRRRHRSENAEAHSAQDHIDVFAYSALHGLVAHHALADVLAAGLELRLDQRDKVSALLKEIDNRRQHQLQRDEAHVDDGEVDRVRNQSPVDAADIRLLQRHDPRIVEEVRMQLRLP